MKRRLFLGVGLLASLATLPAWSREKVVRITARRFTYEPDVITLKKGEPVVLELVTADIAMGFNAPDFNVRADILPGQVSRVRFIPDKEGTFTFLCDIFCGDGHERMSGTLKVLA
ncbi:MAG TPA: cupredoxin domain-containing protein [Burkholderiales bacterium]|nr:cupredoxin domain-containing protein [Burkholderiales bacterium]